MSYLYLNFLDNLASGLGEKAWGKEDFYTTSLTDQYEIIKRKIGNTTENIQAFVEGAFPSMINKRYYISMPGFDRKMQENRRGKKCIYNIVIRPEHDDYITRLLPSNYDVILIGDLTFDSVTAVTIKGIELIDSNVAKFGERAVLCNAACAFSTISITTGGRSITVPDYGTRDIHDGVLTNEIGRAHV